MGASYGVERLVARLRSPEVQTVRPSAGSRQTHLAFGVQASNKVVVHPLSIRPHRLTLTANSNPVCPRRPKLTTYRCSLPGLTGFMAPRRAGPGPQRRLSRAVPAEPRPRAGVQPRYSGLRVQGTASSPSSTTASILPRRRAVVSRRIRRRKNWDVGELSDPCLTVDAAGCPRLSPRRRQQLSLASGPPLM
jgi:hypothetical protein